MAIPSNGITAEVIQSMMPPYQLSADLLDATFARLPPPPPDTSPAQRQARIARLIAEIVGCKPADAGQARIAAQILILREAADSIAPLVTRAHAPELTVEKICRSARTMAELDRTAATLGRSLIKQQQLPVPSFGVVVEDAVDTATLDAIWYGNPRPPEPMPNPLPPPMPAREPTAMPRDATLQPEPPTTGLPTTDATQSATTTPTPQAARTATEAPARRDRSPDLATSPDPDADATPEWTITKLDEGPGWTREVLRHRSSATGGNGTSPGPST
jgi:hypothetical protein